jgi:hypothetical protein
LNKDPRLNDAGTDFRYDNSFTFRKLLALEQADGLGHIENGGWLDDNDSYRPNDTFGPATTPSSAKNNGNSSYYLEQAETLTFAPGETAKTFNVVVAGDGDPETNETFSKSWHVDASSLDESGHSE